MTKFSAAAVLTALTALACAGAPPPAPTATPAQEEASPTAAPSPRPSQEIDHQGTHCEEDEVAWFACTVKGGRVLSLCSTWPLADDTGSLYYRFGALGAIDLQYPPSELPFSQAFRYQRHERNGGMGRPPPATFVSLSFENEGVGYEITTKLSAKLEGQILVTLPSKKPISLVCVGDLRGELNALEVALDSTIELDEYPTPYW